MNRIKKIFSEVPATYELVNHVLTLGLDIWWRKNAAAVAAAGGGTRWLDAASGTGDMAVILSRLAGNDTVIMCQDFSLPMLKMCMAKPEARRMAFCVSDASELPFSDDTFDLVTISFAARNLNTSRPALTRVFSEFQRVLKPGGRFVNLETTQPASKIIKCLLHSYVRLVVAPLGGVISGAKGGYKYLASTIPVFYGAEELSSVIRESGFKKVVFSYMTFGTCAVHTAVK